MIRSALSAALMLAFVLLAPRAEALDVKAETFTLANGMQVVKLAFPQTGVREQDAAPFALRRFERIAQSRIFV